MDDEIGALLSRANLARVRGHIEEAQAICRAALELNPRSADAHSLQGDLLTLQDKHDDALHCYSLAAELKPENLSLREKRDKAIAARHSRLLASQQKTTPTPPTPPQGQQVAPPAQASLPTKNAPQKQPRWLIATLVGLGGVVMLLLGIWLGTSIAHRNDLVPTKTPATVGRER